MTSGKDEVDFGMLQNTEVYISHPNRHQSLLTNIGVKNLQFLNHCGSRINRIKQQKLALPISTTLNSGFPISGPPKFGIFAPNIPKW